MIDPRGLFADMAEDDDDPFFLEPPDFAGALARLRAGERLRPGQMRHLSYARPSDIPAWMAYWNDLDAARRRELVTQLVDQAESDLHAGFGLLLEPLMDDDDPEVRAQAIDGLWERQDEAFARRLTQVLGDDPDDAVRARAAFALGAFMLQAEEDDDWTPAMETSLQALMDVAADESLASELRRQALAAAAHSGRSALSAWIESFLAADDSLLRAGGLRAAGHAMDRSFSREILEHMDLPDPLLRHEAAAAAGDLALAEAVPNLSNLAEFDLELEVRMMAVHALGGIGSKSAVRALKRVQSRLDPEEDEDLDEAVEDALATAELMGDLSVMAADLHDADDEDDADDEALDEAIDDDADFDDLDDDVER
ncbi:MAG TPA: HEAT repeat domain-containing protein [Anaerolineae bacterium]|nr:HEAT repeat domain-containing protein [Anaerolineae bacterium]